MTQSNGRVNPGCWQAAIDVLKPDRRELEHGLELHRESVVVDAYGLGARGYPSEEGAANCYGRLEKLLDEGATGLEISDLLEESGPVLNATDALARENYHRLLDASGVTCIVQNAGQENQGPLRLLRRLAHYTLLTDLDGAFVSRATCPEDIVRAHRENRHCLYPMLCGVPLPQRWESRELELDLVRIFFMLGARMMHLTYNRRNMIGDGCGEEKDAGLSDFGRSVVAEMNRVGVIIDVAHSGQETSREAAAASSSPVVASHTACAALNNHCRAKADATIRSIADSGGYVGICCIGSFLGHDCGIASFLEHIDHAVKLVGADCVAIGTDLAGFHEDRRVHPRRARIAGKRQRPRPIWEKLWPPPADPVDQAAVERAAPTLALTNFPLFTVGLVQKGYSDDEIRKIIGGNFLRVAAACLEESAYRPAGNRGAAREENGK